MWNYVQEWRASFTKDIYAWRNTPCNRSKICATVQHAWVCFAMVCRDLLKVIAYLFSFGVAAMQTESKRVFTEAQHSFLWKIFRNNSYPSLSRRKELAAMMGVKVLSISNWFRWIRYRSRKAVLTCTKPPQLHIGKSEETIYLYNII